MDELYRGWAGGREGGGVGVGGGWEAEGGQYHPQGDKQQGTETATVNLAGPDGRQQ